MDYRSERAEYHSEVVQNECPTERCAIHSEESGDVGEVTPRLFALEQLGGATAGSTLRQNGAGETTYRATPPGIGAKPRPLTI